MNHWLTALLLPAVLGAASPAPLVVGAVRDQFGEPIAGASVTAGDQRTTTDVNGTFALSADTATTTVTITCAYCRPFHARIDGDQPVVAIIRRYDALTHPAPSERDITAAPYAHAESLVSLRPFVVLNESKNLLPGPRVSVLGTSPEGGLLIDNGIPDYDIAAGASPFSAFPAYDVTRVEAAGPQQAFRYGEEAAGGIFSAETPAIGSADSSFIAGNEGGGRIAQSTAGASYTLAASGDPTEARDRADATLRFPIGDDSLQATMIAAQNSQSPASNLGLDGSFTAIALGYDHPRANTLHAGAVLDRSGYDTSSNTSVTSSSWSDFGLDVGVESPGLLHTFADFGYRDSTGLWVSGRPGIPHVAGSVGQTWFDAGIQTSGEHYSVDAGAGAFSVGYSGGTGPSQPLDAHMLLPSLTLNYLPSPNWTASLSASRSFRLPSLLETYMTPTDLQSLPFDLNGTLIGSLDYGDLHRLHADVTWMGQSVSNLDNGTVHALGAALAWQIAPYVSLRAWGMHFNDLAIPYEALVRLGTAQQPSTVGSLWATYNNSGGMRIDLIERRDLIDYVPNTHFDASISAPLVQHLRWYAGTEQRTGVRYYNAGIRFAP